MNDETLFHLALEKPPSDRKSFLQAACAGDDTLRIRVETLLDAQENPGDFLVGPCLQAPLSSAAGAAAPDLGFLEPASRSCSLGRLGHYEILQLLGSGAFGIVLKAVEDKLHRDVAIKVLHPVLAASVVARLRFLREAQAAAAVSHDNIVAIYAVEESGSVPYLVMEYIAGVSLEEKLRHQAPLQLAEVLRIGLETAEGLAAAHTRGLVHRDVKPANILLQNSIERVKITDFGQARAIDDVSLTQVGIIAGTPSYMSPEQARGEKVDHRADLFSLGSVLYAMCTGHPPFRGPTSLAVLKQVCEESPPSIEKMNPCIPSSLIGLIGTLLAKNPVDRIQSAAEVAELLGQQLAHLQQSDLVLVPERQAPRPKPSMSAWRPRWRWVPGLAAAAFLGIVSFFAIPEIIIRIRGKDGGITEIKAPEDSEITIHKNGNVVPAVPVPARGVGVIHHMKGHRDLVWSVALSPDDRRGASAGWDDTVRIWDLESGQELHTLVGHTRSIQSVAFSPDGKKILSGSADRTLRLWDVETGSELRCFDKLAIEVWQVAFVGADQALYGGWSYVTKDGNQVPADCALRLLNLKTGTERRLEGHTGRVVCLAVSSDGRRALSGASSWDKRGTPHDSVIRLWDLQTCNELQRFEFHKNGIESVAFSPDDKLALSSSRDNTIRLWDVESGQEIRRLWHERVPAICRVVFCPPDGRRALGASQGPELWLWDVENGELLRRLSTPGAVIQSVAASSDGRRALSGSIRPDNSLRFWQLPLPEK